MADTWDSIVFRRGGYRWYSPERALLEGLAKFARVIFDDI
jgi:hypothetical protein